MTVPEKWPWDRFGEKPHPTHFARPNPGPHLLRDKDGNTAYCAGPGACQFCERGVPPSGDHHAEQVERIPWIGGNRDLDLDPNNPEDVKAWQERDRQAAAMLDSSQQAHPVVFDASGAAFVVTPSGPGAHDDRTLAAAMASDLEANPYSDTTTGYCKKCHKKPADHYKDENGDYWCVGNVNERYEPTPIYYPAECKLGEEEALKQFRERQAAKGAPSAPVYPSGSSLIKELTEELEKRTGAAQTSNERSAEITAQSHILSSPDPKPRVVDTAKAAAQAAVEMKTPPVKKVAPKKRLCRFCEKPLERWSATMMRCPGCGRNEAL